LTKRPEPVRTCVGCRKRSAKSDLVRVVAAGPALQPDPRGRLPGRGAHLHRSPECLALAVRRSAFARALRLPGPLDATAVADWIAGTTPDRSTPSEGGSTDDSSMSIR
jgi:predicted RNA-binding protein YlxR (DUF448 family)